MTDRAIYDYCAPQYFDFAIKKLANTVSHLDSFDVSHLSDGTMEVDVKSPLPALSGRASSTPKKDCCTQTPLRTDQEESLLSEALETLLSFGRSTRRSVRFSENVSVYQSPPSTPAPSKDPLREKSENSVQTEETDDTGPKRPMTPGSAQSWHQALKYRRVEQRVATPGATTRKTWSQSLQSGSGTNVSARTDPKQTLSATKTVDVKMRVIQKPQVKVEPYKLTEYKPRQTPLEEPADVFQGSRNTPGRPDGPKTAVRRLGENQEPPKPPQFRAKPPTSLYRSPFVPKLREKNPTVPEPFVLHTEKRAKERELFEQRVMEHQLEIENTRRRLAEEKERQEAQDIREMRRVKFHARPVPSFYQPLSSKTPENPRRTSLQRRKTQSLTPK